MSATLDVVLVFGQHAERVVHGLNGFVIGQGTTHAVAAWVAVAQKAHVAFTQRAGGETGIEMVDAAWNLALVGQFAFERGYVIALDGTANPTFGDYHAIRLP